MQRLLYWLSKGRGLQRPCLWVLSLAVMALGHDLLAEHRLIDSPDGIGLYAGIGLWALMLWLLLRSAEALHTSEIKPDGWWKRFKARLVRGYVYLLTAATVVLSVTAVYLTLRLFRALAL